MLFPETNKMLGKTNNSLNILAQSILFGIAVIILVLGLTVLVNLNSNVIVSPVVSVVSPTPTVVPTLKAAYSRYLFVPTFTNPGTLSIVDTQTIDPATSTMKVTTGVSLGPLLISAAPFYATVNDTETLVYISNNLGSSISVLNISDISNIPSPDIILFSSERSQNPQMVLPNGSCMSIDGTLLYVACAGTVSSGTTSGGIAIFNTIDNSFNQFVSSPSFIGPSQVITNPDGTLLFVSNNYGTPSSIVVLSAITLTVVSTQTVGSGTTFLERIAISTDGNYIYGIPKSPVAPTYLPLFFMTVNSTFAVSQSANPLVSNCTQVCTNDDGDMVFAVSNVTSPPGSFAAISVKNRTQPLLIAAIPISKSVLVGITCDSNYIYITDLSGVVHVRSIQFPYNQAYPDVVVAKGESTAITFTNNMRLYIL